MRKYLDLVEDVLSNGTYKPNRTGVDTISSFSQHYTVDLSKGFPLLTTKDMSGFRWNSLIHELLWYLTGEEHIRNLREETKIWDAWADEDGHLDTAYGRFWRRYPVPDEADHLPGETWADAECRWTTEEEDGRLVFDQIQYAIDQLRENPNSRRIVLKAWHPANAAVSGLPPCHFTWVLNVQDGKLNLHLTQRSGDIALGIPFNIACYSILAMLLAREADLELGEFGHTIVDAHIYCGEGERGAWYAENLDRIQKELTTPYNYDFRYQDVRDIIDDEAPADPNNYDHVPGLLTQLTRTPKERPRLEIADKPLDELEFDDFELVD
jgi:thymidylate synthase